MKPGFHLDYSSLDRIISGTRLDCHVLDVELDWPYCNNDPTGQLEILRPKSF